MVEGSKDACPDDVKAKYCNFPDCSPVVSERGMRLLSVQRGNAVTTSGLVFVHTTWLTFHVAHRGARLLLPWTVQPPWWADDVQRHWLPLDVMRAGGPASGGYRPPLPTCLRSLWVTLRISEVSPRSN